MTHAARAAQLHGIYLIVNDSGRALEIARAALAEGVRLLQYRAKAGIDEAHLRALRALTREYGALLLLNDDWRAAQAFECDGVHLGPDDEGFAAVSAVRAALPELVIGLSCGNEAEIRAAEAGGADYAGAGSVFATRSKDDAGAPIGIEGLRRIAAACALPVAAIGGITAENLPEVKRSGVAMAALISAVADAHDPAEAARALLRIWNGAPS